MSCLRHWTQRNKWEKRGGGGTGLTMKIWYSRYGLAYCLPSSGQATEALLQSRFSNAHPLISATANGSSVVLSLLLLSFLCRKS